VPTARAWLTTWLVPSWGRRHFSIGSNDLIQLILGVDRDSEIVAPLFDERNAAVTTVIAQAIATCRARGCKIGICGQAPYSCASRALRGRRRFLPADLTRSVEKIVSAEEDHVPLPDVKESFGITRRLFIVAATPGEPP